MSLAVVQARMGSTRLRGKPLLPLAGKRVLQWVLDRVGRAKSLDAIVVATSTAAGDDCLQECCRQWGVRCFRGSESDVLGRFAAAADAFDAAWIVRINADNPLVDPSYIDQLVADMVQRGAEYASYRRDDAAPVMLTAVGFFTEVISRDCLRRAEQEIIDPFEREHVTLGIYGRPERFDVRWLAVPEFCNDARLRFTLDTPGDLELLERVLAALGDRALVASAEEVVRLANARPDWLQTMAALNAAQPKSASPYNA